jgi:hypothetical protein
MFYELGAEESEYPYLKVPKSLADSQACSDRIGISSAELELGKKYKGSKSITLFSPQSWTAESLNQVIDRLAW